MKFPIITLFCLLCFNSLKGDTLTVAYTRAAPFIITNNQQPEGISIWLWEHIANNLAIDYKLVEMPFGEILKGLENGTVDMSINPLTVTSERSKKMNFTYPFYASNSTVAIKETTAVQQFLRFMRSFLSLNFLRGFIGWIFIIFFFGVIAWLFERKQNPEHFRPGWKGIWDGLWWSIVTMTTVGYGDKSPKSRAGKMIALIWMFSGLLFISSFTASVASMLTVNQLQSNQKGFFEYKEKAVGCFKTRTSGTIQSTGTENYLRHHFFKNIIPFNGLTEGLDALKNGEVEAFLYDEPILKYRIANEEAYQSLEVLPIKFDLQFYAFAFADHHEGLNKAVSQKILEYTESIDWRLLLAEYDLTDRFCFFWIILTPIGRHSSIKVNLLIIFSFLTHSYTSFYFDIKLLHSKVLQNII